ncbi:MAG TPA: hypothetical protein VFV32_00150 [Acidimicrobiales bacterium]|nr:hypothetical protein [Acidimicrobiales bacterium]
MATVERALETGWLDSTPVEDNLLRRFLRNQADLGAAVAVASGGRAAEVAGVALADAGGTLSFVNQATMQRPLTGLGDPTLDALDDFWGGEGRPHLLLSVWPTPDLAARGWRLDGHPMLVVRAPGPHPEAAGPGVGLELVADPGRLAVAESLAIEGYPIPHLATAPAGSVLAPGVLSTTVRYRIGHVDGAPVAVAADHVAHGVVNLCLAATLPAARRRGVWASLVWARVDDAPQLPAVAFTSDLSRPGFVRMGFLPVLRCTLWSRS